MDVCAGVCVWVNIRPKGKKLRSIKFTGVAREGPIHKALCTRNPV